MSESPNREVVIFNGALALAVDQRAAFLDEACAGDAEMRRRVDLLVQAHDRAGAFLEAPTQTFHPGQTGILSKAPRPEGRAEPAPGATVRYMGDYELQEEIGRGGMGVVFRARQVSLNRTVAVKMILAGEFAGGDERRRFQREAESAAQLRHPNIVSIHEVGEHEGRSYFSMDLIEGQSLSTALKKSKMPPTSAAAMVKTLAEAVHFAHQRGTLHRDLKPQNVLLGLDGQPHILDFGLARPVVREAGLTRTGDVMGSPSYMPPEQATGTVGEIGPASDVYALGAILYEAITGKPPFTGETAMAVLTQVVNNDPKHPKLLDPNVPTDLQTICLKCLEKRPERRYHSAQALAEELERFVHFEPILARPASRWRRGWNWMQRNPWVFAAGFGLTALALLGVAYGLWEKTQLLNWRIEAGKEASTPTQDPFFHDIPLLETVGNAAKKRPEWSQTLAPLFFPLFAGVFLVLDFVGRNFRRSHRRQVEGGPRMSPWTLGLQAAVGIGCMALVVGFLLRQIHEWMWHASPKLILGVEAVLVLFALGLGWIGVRMIWEAAGIHETSRYRNLVMLALDRQTSREGPRLRLCRWIGVGWWLYSLILVAVILAAVPGEMICAIAGMVASSGVAWLATGAVQRRRRLFTHVCIPAIMALYALVCLALLKDVAWADMLLALDAASAAQAIFVMLLVTERKPSHPSESSRFPANPWLDAGYALALLVALFALARLVENRRGRAAWDQCKRDLATKGARLDWTNYVPPTVPDDQNIFKAPQMADWFLRRTNSSPLAAQLTASAPWNTKYTPVAEITLLPLVTNLTVAPGGADLVLQWKGGALTVVPPATAPEPAESPPPVRTNDEILPLMALDGVPLKDAIQALARQANLNIMFDPAIFGALNTIIREKFQNVTAVQALTSMLDNYNLRMIYDSGTTITRVTQKSASHSVSHRNKVAEGGPTLDTIMFDSVPLTNAVTTLAMQAALKVEIDPALQLTENVTMRWSKISAAAALAALLDNYGLRLVDEPGSTLRRIERVDPDNQALDASDPARAALRKTMQETLGPTVIDPIGLVMTQRPPEKVRTARIILFCDNPPATNNIEPLFRDYLEQVGAYFLYGNLRVESTGRDSMKVSVHGGGSADAYAAWDEKNEPQLEMIRQALRRPYARADIDYMNGEDLISANYVVDRVLAQMLAATAQAYLLRGDPERALRQMTLIHDFQRIRQGPPGGQPQTLMSAMINTAVCGLYVEIAQEGLAQRAWSEPQLAALEAQLAAIDLPSCVERSFQFEQVFQPRLIETRWRSGQLAKFMRAMDLVGGLPQRDGGWRDTKWNIFARLAPQGWLDRNEAAITEAYQPNIEAFDLSRHALQPRTLDDWDVKNSHGAFDAEFAPYTALRSMDVRFKMAVQTTVKNQTRADQACIVCGLERYRVAHGEYPPTLTALAPKYIDLIPKDIIGGQAPLYERGTNADFQLSAAGWAEQERWTWPQQ